MIIIVKHGYKRDIKQNKPVCIVPASLYGHTGFAFPIKNKK